MKIIGGVPTHARTSAVPVAEKMLTIADKVLIAAQCCPDLETIDSNIIITHTDRPSQLKARQDIVKFAKAEDADWVLVSDDDLAFTETLMLKLREIAAGPVPWLGSLCTQSALYQHFNRNITTSLNNRPIDWVLRPHPSQIWLMRMETVNEIGDVCLEAMQDAEWGLRAWTHGWASARINAGPDLVHRPFISRMKKKAEQGGQTPEVRAVEMPKSIEYMAKKYIGEGSNSVLSVMRMLPENSRRTHITRFNWKQMIANLHNRWGKIGYEEWQEGKLRRSA